MAEIEESTFLPRYYTSLAPFRALFEQGNPILTYHHVGPRPKHAGNKGLYVSAGLFARQLRELRDTGFASGTLTGCADTQTGRRVVVTFDDGPIGILEHALGPLAATQFRAVQFLVAGLFGNRRGCGMPLGGAPEPKMDAARVREWIAAGHDIGSHTLTHPHLTELPRDRVREEISASKKMLEDLFGRPIEHFCYPFGDWNQAARDLVVEAGYRTACTTELGVNTPAGDPFALKRCTARYRSRNLKFAKRALLRRH